MVSKVYNAIKYINNYLSKNNYISKIIKNVVSNVKNNDCT